MAWRLAKSLETLRNQVNAAYPNRSKASDGTIGDDAHASGSSDHNVNDQGVVCALDLTHDPAHGFDAHKLADRLLANRHSNLKYLISNRRIAGAWTGWKWQAYNGSNPHERHIHVSVGVGEDGKSQPPYDSTTKWNIGEGDDEMVTITGLNVIYRFLLGTPPSAYGKSNYLGKVTFDDAYNGVKSSTTYKSRVKRIKTAKADTNSHLPQDMR